MLGAHSSSDLVHQPVKTTVVCSLAFPFPYNQIVISFTYQSKPSYQAFQISIPNFQGSLLDPGHSQDPDIQIAFRSNEKAYIHSVHPSRCYDLRLDIAGTGTSFISARDHKVREGGRKGKFLLTHRY